MKKGYGEFIKKHRMLSGFKRQKYLAEITGISAATISRIENEVQLPEVRTLKDFTPFLTSTTFKELMLACGYSYEDEFLKNELSDEKTVITLNLTVDDIQLTKEEIKAMVTYIRVYRKF